MSTPTATISHEMDVAFLHLWKDICCLAFREAKSSGNEDPLQIFMEKTWLVSGIVMMNVAKMVMVEWALVKSGDESRYMS